MASGILYSPKILNSSVMISSNDFDFFEMLRYAIKGDVHKNASFSYGAFYYG